MLETIAAVCRALACEPRLRILFHLSLERELVVAEIVRRTGLGPARTSAHLCVLAAAALIERRRSGARTYYRLAAGHSRTGRFVPTRLARRAFLDPAWATRGWEEETLLHLPSPPVAGVGEDVLRAFDVVFDASTAFTQVRRLLLLRFLRQMGVCTCESIVDGLKMSRPACYRHLDKLARRRYASRRKDDTWVLSAKHRTPVHAALLAMVLPHLDVQR